MKETNKKYTHISGFNVIRRNAKEDIPIAKVFYINVRYNGSIFGGTKTAIITDPYTGVSLELQHGIQTELSYPSFCDYKPKWNSFFVGDSIETDFVRCVDYPWEDVSIDNSNIGYISCLNKKVTPYLCDVKTNGSASSIGEYTVLYGYIPKGSVYYKLNNESVYYTQLDRYATSTIMLYPYDIQIKFNELTGYDNVCEYIKNNRKMLDL